jgi:hypothetical protein
MQFKETRTSTTGCCLFFDLNIKLQQVIYPLLIKSYRTCHSLFFLVAVSHCSSIDCAHPMYAGAQYERRGCAYDESLDHARSCGLQP